MLYVIKKENLIEKMVTRIEVRNILRLKKTKNLRVFFQQKTCSESKRF